MYRLKLYFCHLCSQNLSLSLSLSLTYACTRTHNAISWCRFPALKSPISQCIDSYHYGDTSFQQKQHSDHRRGNATHVPSISTSALPRFLNSIRPQLSFRASLPPRLILNYERTFSHLFYTKGVTELFIE